MTFAEFDGSVRIGEFAQPQDLIGETARKIVEMLEDLRVPTIRVENGEIIFDNNRSREFDEGNALRLVDSGSFLVVTEQGLLCVRYSVCMADWIGGNLLMGPYLSIFFGAIAFFAGANLPEIALAVVGTLVIGSVLIFLGTALHWRDAMRGVDEWLAWGLRRIGR